MGSVLRLDARDYEGPTRWRWVLADASGALIADHDVRIDDSSWQYEAFTDLEYYISSFAAPDRYAEDEARIVTEVGQWLGAEVFGPVGESLAKAARRAPVTVRVIVPGDAKALLFWPFPLAHAGGRPLVVQDITLVMEAAGDSTVGDSAPVGSQLRVLGLFSLPEGGRALNLRRERHALARLVSRIAARGKAAEALVLQYGVTRERLRDVLEEAEGWDIIHISGHGAPGKLLMETASGEPDKVTATELADMLAPARERVKLVTISACWSAAVTIAEQRRLLGLPVLIDPLSGRASGQATSPGGFAGELSERLGCAVLAMRYRVGDGFAIELSGKLYELLADRGQPLARAVGMTVKDLTAGDRFRALSAATPALFGTGVAEITLAAPRRTGPRSYGTGELKMAGFPPQAESFVGRTGVMARSSAALAEDSGVPGVLLHGMPGGGKTACATELAYTHEHAFDRLVWYKAPDEGMEISGALTDFALALERYLEDFQMVHLVSDAEKLAGFLPRLTELMEHSRVLLVIDNGESLLTDGGQWRDERWGQVVGALTAHRGLGRVIVTSRRVPPGGPGVIAPGAAAGSPGLLRESVDALSADEALLLASELPHLRGLIAGDLPGIDRDTARTLAVGMLSIAQGHPKLLELANGQAAYPERLAGFVASGDQAWRDQGGVPDGFFAAGGSAAEPDDYLHILAGWTNAVTDGLAPAERDLFWVLCCMEEADRERGILAALWNGLWRQLGRQGQPIGLDQALETIAGCGLATGVEGDERYVIHPGISAAGRARAGQSFQATVDTVAAFFWRTGLEHASPETSQGRVNTRLMVRAGFAAAPYLIRQKQWEQAAATLELAFNRDPSRANASAVRPLAQKIADNLDSAGLLLATVTEVTDPAAAEEPFSDCLAAAVASGDHRVAMIAAGRLAYRNLHSGRPAQALDFADQAVSHAQQAGMGPWTMLGTEVQRLQMLSETQDAGSVAPEVQRLRGLMEAAKAGTRDDEAAHSWDVREALLNIDRRVKTTLGEWDDARAVNAEIVASMQARQAPTSQIAVARMNDYGPLLRRGEASKARDILLGCRQVLLDANELGMLGVITGGVADVEAGLGHFDNAIKLAWDALRYGYAAGDAGAIRDVYHNLGNYLVKHASQPAPALACHLCAALIKTLSGTGDIESSLRAAAIDLYVSGGTIEPPAGIADLSSKTGDIPGTDPAALVTGLSPSPETAEQVLTDLIARAQALAEALSGDGAWVMP